MRVHAKSLRSRQTATPWNAAHQAPLSTGFFRQECWNGLPFSSPGDLTDPGIEPGSPASQADSLPAEPPGKPFQFKGGTKQRHTGNKANYGHSLLKDFCPYLFCKVNNHSLMCLLGNLNFPYFQFS